MARKARRDCRVGQRKKREDSQRANAAVEMIKKTKKGFMKPAAAPALAPKLTTAGASFLATMKTEVSKTTKEMVEDVNRRSAASD